LYFASWTSAGIEAVRKPWRLRKGRRPLPAGFTFDREPKVNDTIEVSFV
jgi:hypothetical protein